MPRYSAVPWAFGLAAWLLLASLAEAKAESYPRWNIHTLCARADAVIVGRVKAGDRVEVEKWLLPPKKMAAPPREIVIADLSVHSRTVGDSFRHIPEQNGKVISPGRFVAFLEFKKGEWRSLVTVIRGQNGGSSGLIWLDEGQCYLYSQYDTLGPFLLIPKAYTLFWDDVTFEKMEPFLDEASLLATMAEGLKEREAWEATQNDPDPKQRAARVAAYLLASTSPIKQKTYVRLAWEPLSGMGDFAASAIAEVISRRQPGDDIDEALRALYSSKGDLRPAVPLLPSLLDDPKIIYHYMVISCLGKTEDPSVLPALVPYVLDPRKQVREEALAAIRKIPSVTAHELVERSPYIAKVFMVEVKGSSETVRLYQTHLLNAFRGELPANFLIEVPASFQPPDRATVAFLSKVGEGRYAVEDASSFRKCTYWTVSWYGRKEMLLDDFATEIRREASAANP